MRLGITGDIAVILVAALLGGMIARRLGAPLLLGYILAGIVVGPHTPGPTVVRREDIELLADIGVALLLFTIGLDVPLQQLKPVQRIALLGTPLQILLTMALGYGVGRLLGWGWVEAVWVGALLSLSSTMVVLKTLMEQGFADTLAGRVMLGMLIAQDLAGVPLLILLPALHDVGEGLTLLGVAALRAVLIVAAIVLFGTYVFPRLMARIAGWNSRELFLISVVAAGLGIGYATYLFGLPFAFGAFLAGLVLSESDYSHQALHDITPLRDVFGMLFFVSVGMLIDPVFLLERAGTIAAVVVITLVGKAIVLGSVTRAFGYRDIAPLAVAFGLFQVGEFSFVLAREGVRTGSIAPDVYAVVLTTAVITMVLTPFVIRLATPVHRWWRSRFPAPPMNLENAPEDGWRDHVVIVGYGRIGRLIAQVLHQLGQPFAVVDIDQAAVHNARAAGFRAVYGDAAAEAVLGAAGVQMARLVIVTVPDTVTLRLVVPLIRRLNPAAHVVVRAASAEHLHELGRLGVYEAVQPELEAGLELLRQALLHLGFGAGDIQRFVERVHREYYAPLVKETADGRLLAQLRRTAREIEIEWFRLTADSPLVGRAIGDVRVRETTGASVVAVIRGERVVANPGPDLVFASGDTVGVIGTSSQRAAFRTLSGGMSGDEPG